jgi:transposase
MSDESTWEFHSIKFSSDWRPLRETRENLYRFLESRGYQLCLLHPRQTHQFAQQRGLRAKTDTLDANTIARILRETVRPAGAMCQLTSLLRIASWCDYTAN